MRPGTLHETFAAYRACKALLAREFVPHPEEPKAKPGYEHADDPNGIHAPRVHAPLPSIGGYIAESMLSWEEENWQKLVDRVKRRVKRLPQYQRDVIRVRYLSTGRLPNDVEASDRLRVLGWPDNLVSFRLERDMALITLSRWLRVSLVWAQFRESEQS